MPRSSTPATKSVLSSSGGIGMFILLAIVTLAVLATGVVVLVKKSQNEQQINVRKAGQCCEDGLMKALEAISADRSWRGPVDKTPCGDGWYQVSIKPSDAAGVPTLTLAAEGHCGSVSRSQIYVLYLSINGSDTAWVQQSIKQE